MVRTVLLASTLWLACSGSKPASYAAAASDTIACEAELTKRVLEADSCNEAQFKVEAALAAMKECRSYPRFEVCALRDGGADGHD